MPFTAAALQNGHTTQAVAELPAHSPARRFRNILGGSAGNLVEWFDWYVYSAFAL
jgi:hypothetical protein